MTRRVPATIRHSQVLEVCEVTIRKLHVGNNVGCRSLTKFSGTYQDLAGLTGGAKGSSNP